MSRTILVCAIATEYLIAALFIYISTRIIGIITITIQVTFMKVKRNIELFSDPTLKYTFNPLLQFVMQLVESLAYCSWAFWWYFIQDSPSSIHHGILSMTIISQIAGLAWQRIVKRHYVEPLQDPEKVFQLVQDRMESRA